MVERASGPAEIDESVLRRIWDCAHDGIHVNDASGVFRHVNPAYCAMVGHRPEELIGESFLKLVPPEYRAMYVDFYQSAQTGGGGGIGEFHLRRGDGRRITLLVRHSRLQETDGGLHVFVSRDITEQSAIERKREHTAQMRMLGTLAGSVAHEFNNLLVSILGYAELMQSSRGPSEELLLDFARKIQRAARRGRELTAQLLPFARPEARLKRSVDLHQVVHESADLFQLSSPGVPVRLALDPAPALILGDAIQLHHVFLHLLLNAAANLELSQPVVLETHLVQQSLRRGTQQPIVPYDFVVVDISPLPAGAREPAEGELEPVLGDDPLDRTGLPMALVQGSIASHGGWLAAERGRLRVWLPALTQPHGAEASE